MFQSYFDESGTHDGSEVMCIAGYIIESDQCIKFQSELDEILAAHGIDYFHMTDCAHGHKPFAHLDKSERSEVAKRLIGLIKLRATLGIVVSVSETHFREVIPKEWKADTYTFCLNWCLGAVVSWMNKHDYRGDMAYFFEAGHARQALANKVLDYVSKNESVSRALRHCSHEFLPGKKPCGLAAADLLAWEWRCAYINEYGPKRRLPRRSLESLMRTTHIAIHFTPTSLRDYVAWYSSGGVGDLPQGLRQFEEVRGFAPKFKLLG